MVSKGPPVSQQTIIPEKGPEGTQVPVGVEIKQPQNQYGEIIPVTIQIKNPVDSLSGLEIPPTFQLPYTRVDIDSSGNDYPCKVNINYTKDGNGDDIPVKVDANVTSHWTWKDGQGDNLLPPLRRIYLQYLLKHYDFSTGIVPFGMNPGTTEQNGIFRINVGAWRSQWGLDGLLDTYDLVIGITNLRMRTVCHYGTNNTETRWTPQTLEGVRIKFTYTDPFEENVFPAMGVSGQTYWTDDCFYVKNTPHQRVYIQGFGLESTTYQSHAGVMLMWETELQSLIRSSYHGSCEYDKQITTNNQQKCEKNEVRLPYNCLWSNLAIQLDFSRLNQANATYTFRYAGINHTRANTQINGPSPSFISMTAGAINFYFDFDIYIKSI